MFSSLELLFMFSDIQGSLYKRLEAKMPLNAIGWGYNQSEQRNVWHISGSHLGCLGKRRSHTVGHHHKRPAHIRKRWWFALPGSGVLDICMNGRGARRICQSKQNMSSQIRPFPRRKYILLCLHFCVIEPDVRCNLLSCMTRKQEIKMAVHKIIAWFLNTFTHW